jgi:dolichol-phosphate mannosyltransferase
MKIFVVPATYNEAENIEKFITVLEEEVFPQITGHEMHILVADDYSPDGTGDIVKGLMKKYKNLGINQGERKGLGAAYLRTMGYAIDKLGADVVVSIDADFQFDPHDLPKFVKKLDEGYDVVVQTRYSGGGSIPENWPPQRKVFSFVANLFVRTIFMRFSMHDWTGGFRAIRKEVFLKLEKEMKGYNGYIFQIAFLHKTVMHGFKVGEVPLHFSDRKLGNSKIAPLGYIIDVVTFVIIARIIELQRVIKFLIVGGSGFIVQLLTQEFFARIILASLQDSLRDGISAGVGAEAAIISNFTFNNFWTFQDTKHLKQSRNIFLKFLKFNIASIASVFIQFASVFIFVHVLGDQLSIFGFVIATRIVVLFPTIIFLVIPLNYFIYNKIIWKTQYLKKREA